VRGTGEAGFYTFLAADTVVSILALNPPEAESRLVPLESVEWGGAIGPNVVDVSSENAWDRAVFRQRQGPELWWPFLVSVVALLMTEAFMATSGHQGRQALRKSNPAPTIYGID